MSTAESPEDYTDFEIPSSPTESMESVEALIEMRIQKLYNRRYFLLQMKQIIKKNEEREGNLEGTAGEDDDEDLSELELVERELEELLHQKNNLHKDTPDAPFNGAGPVCLSPVKIESPEGGVYTLPPLLITEDIVTLLSIHDSPEEEPTEDPLTPPVPDQPVPNQPVPEDSVPEDPKTEGPVPSEKQENQEQEQEDVKEIKPADSLGRDGAFTQCPSCEELVFTQTRKFNGDSVWLMCCVCSMFGGFAGLCLVPFCLDKLKSVQHTCPECQAVVHTFHPF